MGVGMLSSSSSFSIVRQDSNSSQEGGEEEEEDITCVITKHKCGRGCEKRKDVGVMALCCKDQSADVRRTRRRRGRRVSSALTFLDDRIHFVIFQIQNEFYHLSLLLFSKINN
jgi:hypothetical protein